MDVSWAVLRISLNFTYLLSINKHLITDAGIEGKKRTNKHLGKHLFSFPSLSSCFHCILNSDPSNSTGEGTDKAGGWGQCITVSFCYSFMPLFPSTASQLLLLLFSSMGSSTGYNPSGSVPAPAWLIHRDTLALAWVTVGLQSSQRHMTLPWSTSFQECISSCAPNSVPFHVSSASSFLSKFTIRPPCISSHLSFFMASGLCLLPRAVIALS